MATSAQLVGALLASWTVLLLCAAAPALSAEAAGGGADSGGSHSNCSDPPSDRRFPGSSLSVYDGVLPSPSARDALREFAELYSEDKRVGGGSTSAFFARPTEPSRSRPNEQQPKPLTPLERALDSILASLSDPSPFVEYWSRQEYINIDVHSDIDEGLLDFDHTTLLHPTHSHVLYLAVQPGLSAPTVVFPDRLVGWDGANRTHARSGERRKASAENGVEMVSVPAVEGRLLRFDGRAMHGAPRPFDRWLRNSEAEAKEGGEAKEAQQVRRSALRASGFSEMNIQAWERSFRDSSPRDDFNYDDEDDDDDEEEEGIEGNGAVAFGPAMMESQQRSVIVFNTWSELPPNAPGSAPPSSGSGGLRGSVRTVEVEDDDSVDDDDEYDDDDEQREEVEGLSVAEQRGRLLTWAFSMIGCDQKTKEREARLMERWRGEFGPDLDGLRCAERDGWTEAEVRWGGRREAAAARRPAGPTQEMEEAAEAVVGVPMDAADGGDGPRGGGSASLMRVDLMGGASRRLHPDWHARLRGPGEALREALSEQTQPARFVLFEDRCQ